MPTNHQIKATVQFPEQSTAPKEQSDNALLAIVLFV